MKHIFRRPLFYLLTLTLIGAFLRFYHLGFKSLWLDEAVIYSNSIGSFSDILHKNALRNSAPPAFTFLIHFITYVGHSEFWLRFPSCLAGILTIPMAYLAFKSHAGKWGSVLGSLLLALSPMQIKYSQEVREYSLVVLLTLILVYFMTQTIEHKGARHYLLFSLFAAIAIQFQYGLALVVMVFMAIILLFCVIDKDKKIGCFFIGAVPVILSVLLVWYISLRYQYQHGGFAASSYLSSAYFDGSIADFPGFCIYNTESIFRFAFNAECKSLLLLLVIIGCCHSIIQKRYLSLFITVGLFGLVFLAGLLSLYPYTGIRQTIFLSVPLYLTASVAVYYLRGKSARLGISVLVGLFLLYGTMDSLSYLHQESNENIKPVLTTLNKGLQPEDRVFVSLGSKPAFEYYFNSLSDRLIFPLDFYDKQREFDYKKYAEVIAVQPGRIWLMFTHDQPQDIEIMINTINERRYVQLASSVDNNSKLYLVTDKNPTNTEPPKRSQ